MLRCWIIKDFNKKGKTKVRETESIPGIRINDYWRINQVNDSNLLLQFLHFYPLTIPERTR